MCMSDSKSSNKFGLGLLFGTIVGGLAALFLSPASGKQNRDLVAKKIKKLEKILADSDVEKKVKEIFGEVTEEATDTYNKAKKEFIKGLAEVKETVEGLDKEKVEKEEQPTRAYAR